MVSDKLEKLRGRLELNDYSKGFELEEYLEDAESFLLSETNRSVLNDALDRIVVDVAYHNFNVDKQFGETSRSEGGVSVSYEKNYPPRILRVINSNRQLKAVRIANANRKQESVLLKEQSHR